MNPFRFLKRKKRFPHRWNIHSELDSFTRDIYLTSLMDQMKENDAENMFKIIGPPKTIPPKLSWFERILDRFMSRKDNFDE
jgi:hypothetical protein